MSTANVQRISPAAAHDATCGRTSFGRRLSLVNGLHVLMLGLLAGMAVFGIEWLHRSHGSVVHGTVPAVQSLEGLRFSALRVVSTTTELALLQGAVADLEAASAGTDLEEGTREAMSRTAPERWQPLNLQEEVRAASTRLRRSLETYTRLLETHFPEELIYVARLGGPVDALVRSSEKMVALALLPDRRYVGIDTELMKVKTELKQAERWTLRMIDEALAAEQRELSQRGKLSERTVQVAQATIIAVSLLIALVALSSKRYLRRHISRPIEELTAAVNSVADGRFDVLDERVTMPLAAEGEVAILTRAFTQMTDSLRRTTVSRDFLDNILSSMNDALAVLDVDGRIRMLNDGMHELLGYAPGELVGQHVARIVACDQDSGDGLAGGLRGHALQAALESLQARRNGAELVARCGTPRPVALTVSPLRDKAGSLEGLVLLAQDISGLLETQSKLCEARDRAEAAARSKSLFLANMSHELRT
ncbi:MAG: PAS domain-containing protein, partial [Gammaproteobacteria bacterium]|nr:PAS domain-containing protein [Gammaproteobacteria bacterium]